jgi:hypothetical protein
VSPLELRRWIAPSALLLLGSFAAGQETGSIRGAVTDQDFEVPLAAVQVTAVETGQSATTTDQGTYLLGGMAPGKYTLVFSREGYLRLVRADVLVLAGQLTNVDAALSGDFTDMEEFVVEDILLAAAGSEAALLELRLESPALLDSISADLMSRAGASDAAAGLRLVAGASVADGKTAVIRGLPDRYVSSQLNGVRLPSADEDKRAVELDQFPSAVIESIQVSKTFTPDQQGDASGGAVNLKLRGIPEESFLRIKGEVSYNSQVTGNDDFLSYDGGGVNFLGLDDGGRDVQTENLGANWDGAAGVSTGDSPTDYKWVLDAGKKFELENGVKLGGFTSLFYERDSSFYDDGVNDSLWVDNPGEGLTPESIQGTPTDGDFKTALYDVTQGSRSVQWGGLLTLGLETEHHTLGLTYLHSHTAEDTATLAQDTRGKEFFFPGYDPDDPTAPGNISNDRRAAPYNRLETLEYTERDTGSLQLRGEHELPLDEWNLGPLRFHSPELSWVAADSSSDLDQPDKRQFGSLFLPESFNSQLGGNDPEVWVPLLPSSNVNLGNFQRIFKTIEEDSRQYAVDVKLPFEQWSGQEGYAELGLFDDSVERSFDQDTFSNFGDSSEFAGGFDEFWSAAFPSEDHPITESLFDIDYEGQIDVSAWYAMLDLPITKPLSLVGGVRFESTDISIVNLPEQFAFWFPPGDSAPRDLHPGDADVSFAQDDVLPALGFELKPWEGLTLRGSYSETVARQTFKELTPILQQEFAGGPVFIGNPELAMSALQNYDLRLDYTPYAGGFLSLSWFYKHVEDPIEYVQNPGDITFTSPVNYPEGELSGYELELRQQLGHWREELEGLAIGANATFIDSEVELTQDEIDAFEVLEVPITSRDMTNAPAYLYNLFLTYDVEDAGAQFAVFYTVEGDTLVAGAGESLGNFVPSVYAEDFGTLNLSFSKRIGKNFRLILQAKNLTNPEIEEVYRSDFIDGDQTRSSSTRGREFSIGISANL